MKKRIALFLMALLLLALPGCGKKASQGEGEESKETAYAEALEVLNAVVAAYKEEDRFSIFGGNQEDAVMDAPGKFDVSKTEELTNTLKLPESQISVIDDAASMVHMMNANTFTGAAYRLKEGTDMEAFAEEVNTGILGTQWICGFPDTLLILKVDGSYVITAYGEKGIMETFKANALSALPGAQVLTETPIA